MANLGELLAELRHDRGLKQEELADILHLSKKSRSQVMNVGSSYLRLINWCA